VPFNPTCRVGDVTLGERDDVHAGEGETLEEACCVFLVPAETVQGLREYNVEASVERRAHECLEAGS